MNADSWVFQAVFAGVGAWLLVMTVVFVRLLGKYTFGKWTVDNPNPYAKETFAMPRGVFRGMLTLSLLYTVVLFEVANIQTTGLETKIEQLLVAFQMMIAFYFGSKVMHHITKADERKITAFAESSPEEKE